MAEGFSPKADGVCRVQTAPAGTLTPHHARRAFLLFFFSSLTAVSWAFLFAASLFACGQTPETRSQTRLQTPRVLCPSPTKPSGFMGEMDPSAASTGCGAERVAASLAEHKLRPRGSTRDSALPEWSECSLGMPGKGLVEPHTAHHCSVPSPGTRSS